MYYSVYILYSSKLDRFYIGTTDDIPNRLIEHNNEHYKGSFTSRGVPWVLYLSIDGLSSEKAYKIERQIKNMKSKKYIQNLKTFPEIIIKLKS